MKGWPKFRKKNEQRSCYWTNDGCLWENDNLLFVCPQDRVAQNSEASWLVEWACSISILSSIFNRNNRHLVHWHLSDFNSVAFAGNICYTTVGCKEEKCAIYQDDPSFFHCYRSFDFVGKWKTMCINVLHKWEEIWLLVNSELIMNAVNFVV